MASFFIGTAAVAATASAAAVPATAGIIGAGGAVTAGGVIGATAVGAAVGGTTLMAYGQYQAGKATGYGADAQAMMMQQQAEAQQAMTDYNVAVAEQDATAIEARYLHEQGLHAEAAERRASSMRAAIGASGVVSTAGTPLLVQAKQAAESELENLMIGFEGQTAASRARSAAKMTQYQGMVQGQGYRTQTSVYRQKAKSALRMGRLGAGTTLLTGFGRTAAMYGGY